MISKMEKELHCLVSCQKLVEDTENGYRVCYSKCGSPGPHVSVKGWNGQKELAQKEARKNGMKGREKWIEKSL